MALACGLLPLYINTYMLTREVIVSVANLYMQGLQAFSNFDRQISCYLFACLRYGAQQLLLQQCGCTGRHGTPRSTAASAAASAATSCICTPSDRTRFWSRYRLFPERHLCPNRMFSSSCKQVLYVVLEQPRN